MLLFFSLLRADHWFTIKEWLTNRSTLNIKNRFKLEERWDLLKFISKTKSIGRKLHKNVQNLAAKNQCPVYESLSLKFMQLIISLMRQDVSVLVQWVHPKMLKLLHKIKMRKDLGIASHKIGSIVETALLLLFSLFSLDGPTTNCTIILIFSKKNYLFEWESISSCVR